ncbi:MAG: hypothetical protein Q4B28_05070 [bacterium]|nr:hypothetical protein [bacterium]
MSVKLAGQRLPKLINERGLSAELIYSNKETYLSKDGYFEEEGVYNEAVLKTRNPSHLLYTMFILPKHTTIYKGGDLQGYFESNGIGETTVYGAINLNHKTAYRDISYTVIATARFLHLVKSKYSAQPNIFSSQVENGDYSGNGWNYEADGYKHQEGNTTALTRTINQVLQSFQVEFACKEWTKGTLQLKIEYTGEEKTKLSSGRSSSHKARTLLYTYKAERNMLINKVAIQGQSQ